MNKKFDILTIADGLTNEDGVYFSMYKDYNYIQNKYSVRTELLPKDLFIPNTLAETGNIVRAVHSHDVDCFIGKERDAGYANLLKDELLLVIEVYPNTQDKDSQFSYRKDLKLDGFLVVRLSDVKQWMNTTKEYPTFYYTSEQHCWTLDKIDAGMARDLSKVTLVEIDLFLAQAYNDVLVIEEKHKYMQEDKEVSTATKKITKGDDFAEAQDEEVDNSYVKLKKGTLVQHYETRVVFQVEKDFTQKMFTNDIKVSCFDFQLNEVYFYRFTELLVYKATNSNDKQNMVVKKEDNEPTEEVLAETVNNTRTLTKEEKDSVCGDLDTVIEKIHELYRLVDTMENAGSFKTDVGSLRTQLTKAIDSLKDEFIAFNHDIVDQTVSMEDYTDYVNVTLTSLDHEFNTHSD